MKKFEKILTAAVIATVSVFVIGFLMNAVFALFGNPLDRKNIRNIAEQYLAENYSEMNPEIVDIDYFDNYLGGPYQVEVYLEKSDETFWLHYFSSGELDWDTYNFSDS